MSNPSRRLSEADAIFLPMGKAVGGAMAPVSIAVYEGPFDPADHAHQRELLTRLIPAMRRRIARDRASLALPRWVDVPDASPDDNWLFLPPPGDGTLRAILDWAAAWGALPFPADRPPWRAVRFDGVEVDGTSGRTVVVSQMHHAVIDGGGARRMAEHYLRFTPDEPLAPLPPLHPPEHLTGWERWKEGWALEGTKAKAAARAAGRRLRWAAAEPRAATTRAADLAKAARRLTSTVGPVPLSPLLRRTSTRMRFDIIEVDLAALKAGARAAGGSINDGLMASVSLGLRQWHLDHGVRLPQLRTAMAVNRRAQGQGWQGNEVLAVVVEMPVDDDDPARLVKRCREVSLSHREDEDALWLLDRIRAAGNRLPFRVSVALSKQSLSGLDVSVSNVAGVPERHWQAHREQLSGTGFVVGTLSAVAMVMSSSAGRCRIGITTCPDAVRDPAHLVRRLEEGLAAVYALEEGSSSLTV